VEGPLAEFSITDIISLVSLGKRTGRAEISGQLNGHQVSGALFFKSGNVCQATLLDLPALEAALTFFIFEDGYFHFYQGQAPDREDLKVSNEMLIMQGINRLDQWKEIRPLVHPGDVPVLPVKPSGLNGGVTLKPDDWRFLTYSNGQLDIFALGEKSKLGQFKATLAMADLLKMGLVEKKPRTPGAVFYPELESLALSQLGQPAQNLVEQAYQRAGFRADAELTLEQAIQVVNHFRRLSALLVGPGPSEMLDEQIRGKLRHLYHR